MKFHLFMLPTIGRRHELEQGMAGLRDDLYQRMLGEIDEQARFADELFGTTCTKGCSER